MQGFASVVACTSIDESDVPVPIATCEAAGALLKKDLMLVFCVARLAICACRLLVLWEAKFPSPPTPTWIFSWQISHHIVLLAV